MDLLPQAVEHHRAGRLEVADQLYRKVLEVEPASADAWHLLGVTLYQRSQFSAAADCLLRAIAIDGAQAPFHVHLAAAYAGQQKTLEAIASYRTAIGLRPEHVKTYSDLGALFARLGRWDDAAECLRHAVRIEPGNAPAHNNLGKSLEKQGLPDEAIARYREALRLQPNLLQACMNLGNVLLEAGRIDEAIACQRRALAIDPRCAPAHNALGALLQAEGKLDEAKACYQRALEIQPNEIATLHNLGMAYFQEGALAASREQFERILGREPDNAQAHYWRGSILLTVGDFAGGWPEYEWRRRTKFAGRSCPGPLWRGEDLHGRRILIYREWGLGDTLQFIRYVPLVVARGGDVWLVVQPALIPLLELAGFTQLVADGTAPPEYEVQVPILSLPAIFGTTLATIPASIPYLSARPDLVETWRDKLQAYSGLKIGIHWRGSQASVFDARSIRLTEFEPLARLPGTTLVSLQQNPDPDEWAAAQGRFTVVDFGDQVDRAHGPFMDTAAIMANMDLVVTNDTAIAHLAGGLGVPVWLALNYAAAWVWLQDRDDTPWYPTMRLFRQSRRDHWTDVFEQMAAELPGLSRPDSR